MPAYTVEQLCKHGPQYAMAMLVNRIKSKSGEPFVTYGAISSELEHQLKIKKIFATHIGHVAEALMDQILKIDPKAPLINVLITRPTGIPGAGAARYLADHYGEGDRRLRKWDELSLDEQKEIIGKEREKIFKYRKWEEINRKLFGESANEALYDNENQGTYGGSVESDEHKKLKEWVASNPSKIGVRKSFGLGEVESRLLSGDTVDVVFSRGNSFRVVEVKSCRSNDEDFRRGIYQCVKYREVKRAEYKPHDIDVQPILVTERVLNSELRERAKLLGVKWKRVSVN